MCPVRLPRLFFALILWCFGGAQASAALPDFASLVERHAKAVVTIRTVAQDGGLRSDTSSGYGMPLLPKDHPLHRFFEDFLPWNPGSPPQGSTPSLPDISEESVSFGSGFIVSREGHIITNHHLVVQREEIAVQMNDRREFSAVLIGSDEHSDIALLKINVKDLPVLQFGDSSTLKVGHWVLAIGAPFGFNYSATAGIISAIGRSLPEENYMPYLQTDVAINRGNSGGPLFNLDGEVIGVNSSIYSPDGDFPGVSFAVPVNIVKQVYEQLRDAGQVRRGWLGVTLQDMTPALADSFQVATEAGALIADVKADSPADQAGLMAGDIIRVYDGKPVNTAADLPSLVGVTPVGKEVPVQIVRSGEPRTIRVQVGSLTNGGEVSLPPSTKGGESAILGMVVRDMSADERQRLQIEDYGVWVHRVGPGAGRDAGIEQGDVILLFNNVKLRDRAHLLSLMPGLPQDRPVPVLVQRKEHSIFLSLYAATTVE